MIGHTCEMCGGHVEGADREAFAAAVLQHIRADHPDAPFPDDNILNFARNLADATERVTGPTEPVAILGEVTIERVTPDRIADWLSFFDHDAFADNLGWADCYCAEPLCAEPGDERPRTWQQNRDFMIDRLESGDCVGYLAYVDGRPAAWVNASTRAQCARYRIGDEAEPNDRDVVSISCFVIAPPYRRHGLASALLERAVAEAPERGAAWVEAYPARKVRDGDGENFKGLPTMFTATGFEPVEEREHHVVVRRPA